jgi:hypothetical protein
MKRKIGRVKSPKGKLFDVYWDDRTGEVFVQAVGGFFGGGLMKRCSVKAKTASEAMHVAEACVYDQ